MGDKDRKPFQLSFNGFVKVDFQGSRVTSDGGLQRSIKTGGRLLKHARYYWLLLAEGHLNRKLFSEMLSRIWALPVPGG